MQCRANAGELMKAWTAFTMDNESFMPGSIHGGIAQNPQPIDGEPVVGTVSEYKPWAQGWQTWDLANANTNANYFANPKYGSLAVYVGVGKNVVKCPEDRSLSALQKRAGWTQRVRTYSGNITIGRGNGGPGDGSWNNLYRKITKISETTPTDFMFLEEHPNSINDAGFWPPQGTPGALLWINWPANFHFGGAIVTAADGRAEPHAWTSATVRTLPVKTETSSAPVSAISQKDLQFLFDRTPKLAP